jgi:hypothetical protein
MNIHVKISQHIFDQVNKDLSRPHRYAHERIGFLFFKHGTTMDNCHLLLSSYYLSIPDEQYINDPTVGAKINSAAIRSVMQRILDTQEGTFHVHMHGFPYFQQFSTIDRDSLIRLIPSFKNVGQQSIHGALLFTKNIINGIAWLPAYPDPVKISKITIVGSPLVIY